MTTLTKGVYARKRWEVVETKEAVRADGSKRLTLCIRRKRESETKKRKTTESLALVEEAEQSQKKKRKAREFLALAKEAHSLNPGPPLTGVRAAKVVVVGALEEDAVAMLDFRTRRLTAMIQPAVLREDDRQKSHAPLSGRDGRACVKTAHEKSMYPQGKITNDVKTYTRKGVSKTPSERVVMSESGSESDSDEVHAKASEGGAVDTWIQCDACQKWRNVGNECQPVSDANFVCSDVEDHTCDTPEEPYD
jgi:hypothetical protein